MTTRLSMLTITLSGLGYEGRFADQEIGAEFVSFDGLVYDRFDRTHNVATVDTAGWQDVLRR